MYHASRSKLKIGKSTYHQIQASRKSRTLFPNLREIYCQGRWEEVCLLLSPSLRRVVILEDTILDPPSLAMFTFINALPKICPDLQSLEVYLHYLASSAMRSVQKLQNLQYLGLEFLLSQESNIEHYTGISLLPNLRLLQFSGSRARWSAPEFEKFLPTFYSPEAFCALQQLYFYASLESIANWLPSFISPNLTTFTAEIEATSTDDDEENERLGKELCYKLCDTLANHARSPLSTLRTLLFISKSYFSSTEVEAFQPLLALRGLETLVFDIPLIGFGDQILIKWARAWSNLKTFRVEFSSGDDSPITLFGMRELFQCCPDLKSLTLSFDATELDSVPEIPMTPSLHHGLKDWDITYSQVNPATVGPVLAILNWVFLDMWHVKSRRFGMANNADSEVLPHSVEQVAAKSSFHGDTNHLIGGLTH